MRGAPAINPRSRQSVKSPAVTIIPAPMATLRRIVSPKIRMPMQAAKGSCRKAKGWTEAASATS